MEFKDKVVFLRIEKGLTQSELGEMLNVTKQAVQKWEKGLSMPDISTILKLSRIFGVDMESLVDDGKEVGQGEPEEWQSEEEDQYQYGSMTYAELIGKKRKWLKIIWIVTVAIVLLSLFSFFIPDIVTAWIVFGNIAVIAILIGGCLSLIPLLTVTDRYEYHGHEIICYAGASTHYLIIDNKIVDVLHASGIIKERQLKGKIDGKDVIMTIRWDNSTDLKAGDMPLHPIKKRKKNKKI